MQVTGQYYLKECLWEVKLCYDCSKRRLLERHVFEANIRPLVDTWPDAAGGEPIVSHWIIRQTTHINRRQ
jgi:hypothetical protein